MSTPGNDHSVRASAMALIEAIDQYNLDRDSDKLRRGLLEATQPLLARPDLMKLGTKRQANHIDNSKWLYYDGQLSLTLDEFPKDKLIPPHDHGIWEALILCSGRLSHTVYARADDGKVAGHAELRVVEDVELTRGEITMVVPPGDIHSFKALSDGTFVITIVGGEYSPTRHYYRTEDNTYVVRTPKALRDSGALA
jgi:predicted metal-dependent enzyme (double-stranded beta helix superfamily)